MYSVYSVVYPSPLLRIRRRYGQQGGHGAAVFAVDQVYGTDLFGGAGVGPLFGVGHRPLFGRVELANPGDLGTGERGGRGLPEVRDVDILIDGHLGSLAVRIVDDVFEQLVLPLLPHLLVVAGLIDAGGVEEEERIRLAIDRDACHRAGQLVRHAGAVQHDGGGDGRGGEVVDLVEYVAEGLLAVRKVFEGECFIPEPATVVAVLVGELADVDGLVGQLRARDDGLAAGEGCPQIAEQGGDDGALLHPVFRHGLVLHKPDVAEQNASRATRIGHQPTHVDERAHLLVEIGRALRVEGDVVQPRDLGVFDMLHVRDLECDLFRGWDVGQRELLRLIGRLDGDREHLAAVEGEGDLGGRVVHPVADPEQARDLLRFGQGDGEGGLLEW